MMAPVCTTNNRVSISKYPEVGGAAETNDG